MRRRATTTLRAGCAALGPQEQGDEDDFTGGEDGASPGGAGDHRGVHNGGHAGIEERLALAADGQIEGDGQHGFDKRGIVVAVENGPHDGIGGVGGVKEPEDPAVGSKCLDGGEDGNEEGEPEDGGTKPAVGRTVAKDRDADQEDRQERGPTKDGESGIEGVCGAAGEPLERLRAQQPA